jgi:chromosome segregation ATPase
MNANSGSPRNGYSWTRLLPAGTLLIAVLTGAWSVIRYQADELRREIVNLKESAASARMDLRRQAEQIGQRTDKLAQQIQDLDDTKLEIDRFNQVLSHLVPATELTQRDEVLQKQIDALAGRLNKLEKDHTPGK